MTRSLSPIRVGVVGTGYFGRFHAAKYAQMPGVELVAVADADPQRASAVGCEFSVPGLTDYQAMIERVDAVSIATPATTHHAIASRFLAHGRHVLVEKPIACTLDEADELIGLAAGADVILQVGHQERFYFSQFDLTSLVPAPSEITFRRAGEFSGRGIDCSVVFDVMIHDLDLLGQITTAAPAWRGGYGERKRSGFDDVAEVALDLDGTCRALLFASRVSDRRERRLRITSPAATLEIDFVNHRFVHAPARAEAGSTNANADPAGGFARDWLAEELSAFIDSIRSGRSPIVGGADGRRALELALLIDRNLGAFPVAREA